MSFRESVDYFGGQREEVCLSSCVVEPMQFVSFVFKGQKKMK